jgi:hypothetical protein
LWTDDQITGDTATGTWLDAKVSVEEYGSLRGGHGVCGNHLTRTRSATAGESARGLQ